MEKMVRKICLDSDIIINILNGEEETKRIIEKLEGEFYITSVSSFEIWYGRKNTENIFELIEWLKILDLDLKSSLIAGDILIELKKTGSLIDIKDLFIASMCIKNSIELLTLNKKHFERLKKFGLILV